MVYIMAYDYRAVLRQDILEYLNEITERDFDALYDEMFIEDSITGNASGSYTFSTYIAEENLAHNWDLIQEALSEFGAEFEFSAEAMDVTIRCYLLAEVLAEVLEENSEIIY